MKPFTIKEDAFTKNNNNITHRPSSLRPFSASVNKFPLTKKKFFSGSCSQIAPVQSSQNNIQFKFESSTLKVNPHQIERMMSVEHRPYLENEKLYEHCMHLKNTLNNLNKKLFFAKSDIAKKDFEINKQSKIIQDIYSDAQNSAVGQLDLSKGFFKIKEMNLVSSLKKKYQDMKWELREKESELQEVKRTMRSTKIKEAVLEAEIYQEEMNCLKGKYSEALMKISGYEKLEKEIKLLRENYTRQETILLQLQEENRSLKAVTLSKPPLKNDINSKKTKNKHNTQEMEAELEKKNKYIQELEIKIQRLASPQTNNTSSQNQNSLFDFHLSISTFDQIQEFTHLLIKNLQCFNIDCQTFEENVINMEIKDSSSESPCQVLANALIAQLKIKGINDKAKIFQYSKNLYDLCKCDIHEYKSKLKDYFARIEKYNFNQDKNRLKRQLLQYKDAYATAMTLYDSTKTGCVNYYDAKKAICSALPNASSELTELVLYAMKRFEPESLEGMRYDKVVELLNEKEDKDNDDVQKDAVDSSFDNLKNGLKDEKVGNSPQPPINKLETAAVPSSDITPIQENEEEVVITIEQFNKKVDKVLSQIAEKLLTAKKSVKEFFKELITQQTVTEGEPYDAIPLKDFIQILQNNGITLDTIDIYCIFSKLKYSDDYETIEINKLQEEMINYGIFEENIGTTTNENKDERKGDDKLKHDEDSIDLNKIVDMEVEGLD